MSNENDLFKNAEKIADLVNKKRSMLKLRESSDFLELFSPCNGFMNDSGEPIAFVVDKFIDNCIEKTDRKIQETYELIKQQK